MKADFRITSIQALRDYMFRKLGEEYVDVEISPLQWNDILRDSINIFTDYSNQGSYEGLILIDMNRQRSMILPEEVMGIKEVLGTSNVKYDFDFVPTYISGDINDKEDFFYGALKDGSVSYVPTLKDVIYDGGVVAGNGAPLPASSVKPPQMKAVAPSLYGFGGEDLGFTSGMYFPFVGVGGTAGGDMSMTSYAISMQTMDTAKSLFKQSIHFQYKPETKRLTVGKAFEFILVNGTIREAPENFINDLFFKLILEEKLLVQWADNLALKYKSEQLMGNGIDLNIERMDERANYIREKLEAGYDNGEWDTMLLPRRIG